MAQIQKGTTYSTSNPTVTIENLNQHVDNATLLPGAIADQVVLDGTSVASGDQVLLLASGQLKRATVSQVLGGITLSNLLNRNNNLSDLSDVNAARTTLSINNVDNKSSATIRSELTLANVTAALTYLPVTPTELSNQATDFSNQINTRIATSQLAAINGVATLGSDGKLTSNQVAALNSTAQLSVLGTQALSAIGAQPLVANALLPKAMAVFSGQFTDTVSVTGMTWSRASGANSITVSKVNVVNDNAIKVNHRLWLNFVANSGSTAPAGQLVEVTATPDDNTFTATLSTPGTAPSGVTWTGSCTFRKCLIHSSSGIDNILMLTDTAGSAHYIANFANFFASGNFAPILTNCAFTTATGVASASSWVPLADYIATGPLQRTSRSFGFSGWNPSSGYVQMGYRSSLVVFGAT